LLPETMPEPFYPSDLTDSEWQIIDLVVIWK